MSEYFIVTVTSELGLGEGEECRAFHAEGTV